MTEHADAAGPAPEPALRRLRDLRQSLLRLHKALLDDAREGYERARGPVASSGELLQLVLNHEWFAGLRPVSELIVRIDEMLAAEEPVTAVEARDLLAQSRALLTPSATADGFGKAYYEAMQRDPSVVLAHAAATRLLASGS